MKKKEAEKGVEESFKLNLSLFFVFLFIFLEKKNK